MTKISNYSARGRPQQLGGQASWQFTTRTVLLAARRHKFLCNVLVVYVALLIELYDISICVL